jgi:molybdopterin synthase sulfur carrier subunit
MMRGTVKFFASLREAAQCSQMEWELVDEATVETLVKDLREKMPGLNEWADRSWIAVNQRYAAPHTTLQDGDEVAFFPPVSGG